MMKSRRREFLGGAAAALAGMTLPAGSGAVAQAKTQLMVYTALEVEQVPVYQKAFEADNPDIELVWFRDSSGVVAARFLAEKGNPKADIFWALSAAQLIQFDNQGLLEPYTPKGVEGL